MIDHPTSVSEVHPGEIYTFKTRKGMYRAVHPARVKKSGEVGYKFVALNNKGEAKFKPSGAIETTEVEVRKIEGRVEE